MLGVVGQQFCVRLHGALKSFRVTYTANGKREFVPRDQVFQHQLYLHCLVEVNLTHTCKATCALLFITSILN